jgi:hypothetical protein
MLCALDASDDSCPNGISGFRPGVRERIFCIDSFFHWRIKWDLKRRKKVSDLYRRRGPPQQETSLSGIRGTGEGVRVRGCNCSSWVQSYGDSGKIHTPKHLGLSEDLPIVIEIVGTDKKNRFVPFDGY